MDLSSPWGISAASEGDRISPVTPSLFHHSKVPVGSRAGSEANRQTERALNRNQTCPSSTQSPSVTPWERRWGSMPRPPPPLEPGLTLVTHQQPVERNRSDAARHLRGAQKRPSGLHPALGMLTLGGASHHASNPATLRHHAGGALPTRPRQQCQPSSQLTIPWAHHLRCPAQSSLQMSPALVGETPSQTARPSPSDFPAQKTTSKVKLQSWGTSGCTTRVLEMPVVAEPHCQGPGGTIERVTQCPLRTCRGTYVTRAASGHRGLCFSRMSLLEHRG